MESEGGIFEKEDQLLAIQNIESNISNTIVESTAPAHNTNRNESEVQKSKKYYLRTDHGSRGDGDDFE